MSTDTADKPMPDDREKTKRTRRAEPITKRVAKNGAISYEFRVDMGDKPDGTRDRRSSTTCTSATSWTVCNPRWRTFLIP